MFPVDINMCPAQTQIRSSLTRAIPKETRP